MVDIVCRRAINIPVAKCYMDSKECVMDGIANVAKQQAQSQISLSQESQKRVDSMQSVQKTQESSNQAISDRNKKMIEDENQVKDLVDNLNKEISLLNTSLRFGVDKQDVFYVSIIDKKTDKMIRRWPAEKAQQILPKMKEFTGLLFDTKG